MAVDVSPKKLYAIEITDRGEFLHVVIGAKKVTPEIALDYWSQINDECERLGRSKILLEHDVVEMAAMPDLLKVIGTMADVLQGRVLAFHQRYGHSEIPAAG